MKSNLRPVWAFPPKGLRFLVVVLLLLGIFFRFVNIDGKVYWLDEAFTSLRISGYTMSEVVGQVCNDRQINFKDLQKYQRAAPDKTLTDTIKSLAAEDPQHPPLYYTLTRFWVQWFGSSVAVTRSLSAIISLLVFPCIYWLCLELFESSLVGWVAVALIAVSPFHVLYAQEARQYSLWTVTILLSSAALLRAMRLKTKLSWGMYAVSVVLGLYTFLFSGLVMMAHGVYVFASENFRLTKIFIAYLLASLAALLGFIPWFLVVISQLNQVNKVTDWTYEGKLTLFNLIRVWVTNLSYFFADFGYDLGSYNDEPKYKFITKILLPLVFIFVGYSLYFIYRNAPKQVWLFVFTIIGVTTLPLAIPDLILGGARTIVPRYLIPAYLCIQLAVSYLLATQIIANVQWREKLWQLVMVALLSVGIISCVISSQAETWWLKSLNLYTPEIVRTINATSRPLVISFCDGNWPLGDELPLSRLLDQKVRLQLVSGSKVPSISSSFTDVFLYNAASYPLLKELRYNLEKEQKYKIEEKIYPKKLGLWKLTK